MNYLVKVRKLIEKNDKYPKRLKWNLSNADHKIVNDLLGIEDIKSHEPLSSKRIREGRHCINSLEAYKTIQKFSKESGVDKNKILALTSLILSIVPNPREPKIMVNYTRDFDGVYDFEFIVEDPIELLVSKVPMSKPKRDPKAKQQGPVFKSARIQYMLGFTYDPRTGLMKLRCRIHPQRSLWGFRFEEKRRSFEDLLKFMASDLIIFRDQDQMEVVIKEDGCTKEVENKELESVQIEIKEEDEGIIMSEEDL